MKGHETKYEWTFESVDEFGDIVDSDFSESLSGFDKGQHQGEDLGLVRNEGDEINGLQDRFFAYVKDGKLPDHFDDHPNMKVPKRYHKELERFINQKP